MTRLTMAMTLMRMFMDGPEVSLSGSPTVSPTTQALWVSEPLPPWWPSSTYFLALSQAPPALDIMRARRMQPRRAPQRVPARATAPLGPNPNPTTRGVPTARRAGRIMRLVAARVAMSTHLSESGSPVPSRSPGISRNWRRISAIMSKAALPTASIVMAPLRNGTTPPMKSPTKKVRRMRGIAEVEIDVGFLDEGGDEGEGGETGGTDREALADGGGGVADRVESVGDLAGFGSHGGHFGDARRRCRRPGRRHRWPS